MGSRPVLGHGPDHVLLLYERIAFSDVKDFLRFGTREEEGKRVSYTELREDQEVDGQLVDCLLYTSLSLAQHGRRKNKAHGKADGKVQGEGLGRDGKRVAGDHAAKRHDEGGVNDIGAQNVAHRQGTLLFENGGYGGDQLLSLIHI